MVEGPSREHLGSEPMRVPAESVWEVNPVLWVQLCLQRCCGSGCSHLDISLCTGCERALPQGLLGVGRLCEVCSCDAGVNGPRRSAGTSLSMQSSAGCQGEWSSFHEHPKKCSPWVQSTQAPSWGPEEPFSLKNVWGMKSCTSLSFYFVVLPWNTIGGKYT